MQRILVVDDVEVNRELLRNMLEDEYIVETAEDGEQAVRKLGGYRDEIAALLLDLQMPKMDGFAVMSEMKERGWLKHIPVLVISSEDAVEVENQCFELGVSDFVHKPFEASIIRNRIRNTVELFACKNQLEHKIEEQSETMKKQDEIIRMQAEQLRNAKPFNNLMMEFQCAIMEVETKLKVLNEEFSQEYNRNPFESIKSRLKSPESIYEKLRRKGYATTVENIRDKLTDVAGIRVICSFPDDIYRLAELFIKQDDIILIKRKDYIKNPKKNGYRSLHLIVDIPIFLSNEKKYMKVEVQFRTIAMDFWASLEHQLKYKQEIPDQANIVRQLGECAEQIASVDQQMWRIRQEIEKSEDIPTEEEILLEKLSRIDIAINE